MEGWILGGILFGAIYIYSKYSEDRAIRDALEQIQAWSRDSERVKKATGYDSFMSWLISIPADRVNNSEHLALDALSYAQVTPFGAIKGRQLAVLGYELRKAWATYLSDAASKR